MKDNKTNSASSVNIKKRVLIVICAALICALVCLILSAFILKKDIKSTAAATIQIKQSAALIDKSETIEKRIALYRAISEDLNGEISVRELRQSVSFEDDDVSQRQLISNVSVDVDANGRLTMSFGINEPSAVTADGEWAKASYDRNGSAVISIELENVYPRINVSASASGADKAKQLVNTIALKLVDELFGEETVDAAAINQAKFHGTPYETEEDAIEEAAILDETLAAARLDNELYSIGEAAITTRDELIWPNVWSFALFGLLAGLLVAFLVCFTVPIVKKQTSLKWWSKLLIIILCTALAGTSVYLFCEKIVRARYVDTLSSTLKVDESGEKQLLAYRGDEFGEKVYNILNAYTDQIGDKVNASRSAFYTGVYFEIQPVDPTIETPRNGLQGAISQTVDEETGTVIFTVKASDDLKAQRIATAAVNELGKLMFGNVISDDASESDEADETEGVYLTVRLSDPEPDSAEVHLYEYLINGTLATSSQISASVQKVEEDENAKVAGNVQWTGTLYVSEQNVIEQMNALETVSFYGQKLDMYDGVSGILENDSVYEKVAADMAALGRTVTVNELREMVGISTSASNRELSISVTDQDADRAADIVSSLSARIIEEMFEGVEGGAQYYAQISEPLITQSLIREWPATITWVILAVIIALTLSYILFSQQSLFDSLVVIFFVLFTILCVFPFYYLFINTISDNELVAGGRINFFPRGLHLTNYQRIFKEGEVSQALLITVLRTIIGTALMVLTSAWAGYLVTKQKMWKRSLWYRALVVTMYFNAGLIPWYTNMMMLGLTNNFLAYLIPGMVAPYNIILVKTYVESIPGSLEESAIIDGASTTKVFMRIILPLSIPILATIAIFGAVGNWNSFQDSLLLMSSTPKLYTLQHRLYIYLTRTTSINTEQLTTQQAESLLNTGVTTKYTIAMVTIIPILLVYPFMQRYFVKGIMLGAVKG